MQTAYIIGGLRTPVAKSKRGAFKSYRPEDMAVDLIKGLLAKYPQLDPKLVDDVIVGNAVPEAEQGLQVGRIIANRAVGEWAGGVTVNRYCGSGLECIAMATAKIQSGMADCIIAGGVESMSLVPTAGWRTMPNYEIAKENGDYYLSMGLTAEQVAQDYNITREEQDAFALQSHQKAIHAIEQGYFKEGILPMQVTEVYLDDKQKRKEKTIIVDTDEGPRADTSIEVLAKLPAVFAQGGSVTAGNSSQTSDGAAFTIVMSERLMKQLGLQPMGRLINAVAVGVDPRVMGIGPIKAIPRALELAGMQLDEIDLIELNEAFASQSVAVIKTLGLNQEKVNINGGAIALGHPLGCTGAKLTVQILNDLKRLNKKYGMVTACIGGGQGIAGIIERL